MLFRAHVHSLDRRSRNAHDHFEQTITEFDVEDANDHAHQIMDADGDNKDVPTKVGTLTQVVTSVHLGRLRERQSFC